MKKLILGTFYFGISIFVLAMFSVLQQQGYENTSHQLCEKYYNVPEKHLDRVPSGCTAQYFEHIKASKEYGETKEMVE